MEQILKDISNEIPIENYTTHTEKPKTNRRNKFLSCGCNVYKCQYCNGNKPRLTKEQLEKIKEKNETRTKPIPYKRCTYNCRYCEKRIPQQNDFIYEKNLQIEERRKAYQNQSVAKNDPPKNDEIEAQSQIRSNIENGRMNTLTNEDRDIFDKLTVKGDGNCAIRALLQSVGINQEIHNTFRQSLADEAQKTDFQQETLTANGFSTKQELIDYIRTDRNYLGMDHILLILEKYNANINIWLDNKINGMKWLKLNYKNDPNQPKFYVNYKDYMDQYPDRPDYAKKIAHYDALSSKYLNCQIEKQIINIIINKTVEERQINSNQNKNTSIKILLWNINSMRDFTIKSFLIQQMYNNNIDIALINETMLNKSDKIYIKGYKVYRVYAKTRKGVTILISNRICCDSYKTMSDDEGRFIQVKLKDSRNEITIATAYVEPEKEHIIDILPENIINSEIFAGDLNKMKTGLETTAKVYYIKNVGTQKTKIEVIKKISDHPIIIYEKNIPFEKSPDKKIINTLDNNKIKINKKKKKKAFTIKRRI